LSKEKTPAGVAEQQNRTPSSVAQATLKRVRFCCSIL